ncbi:MAG TPA: PAS domain S-box protein [Spirochaetota bacterium]|nr:PAS domain S-box protein [Spirochaetota bacterium]
MIKTTRNPEKIIILHLEDSPEDAELIESILVRGELNFYIHLVSDRTAFREALNSMKPDIILSDFDLPGFDGFQALTLSKESVPDAPFIFVTGAVGEEMAVTSLKSGATDFILKSNLGRLVPAVKRAVDENRIVRERKKLYNTLKINEERFRTLMENLPVGVFRTSISEPGRIIQANPAMASIFGFDSIDQMFEITVEDLYFTPEDRRTFVMEMIEHKKIGNRLIRYKKVTGEAFWGSISATCHFYEPGNPDWIDGVVEDVTGKIETQEKLGSHLQFLETLINTIHNPVYYKDINGIYLGCNHSFAEMIMGLPREKILNKTAFDLNEAIPYDLALKFSLKDKELIDNPGIQIYESPLRCTDGITRVFHFNKTTYNNPEGDVAGIVGVMVDITERVANERELKRINEELDLLITSLSSIIIGVSIKDHVTHWNPFAEKVFGISSSDIIGKAFYDTGINWDWGVIYEAISNSIIDEKSVRVDELKYENKEGRGGILGLTINPLKRGMEKLDGFIILGKDLTEQKILEAQLLQSNKLEALGQLAAGVAHEINTPLQYVGDNLKFINKSFIGLINILDIYERAYKSIGNAAEFKNIIIQAEELSKKIKLPFLLGQMPQALEQSLEGVSRMSGIVQSMKAFSHPGSGQKMPANINKAIENTVTVSRNEWKYDCELNLDLDMTLPEIPCLESELSQVILNLIVNARDAILEAKGNKKIESGIITICTAKNNTHAIIKVQDNGTGIPEKIKDKIFDPFFTTKDVGKGTGQGLAISHSIIVEKHSGSLYFESMPGKGTTFIIKLPLEEKE